MADDVVSEKTLTADVAIIGGGITGLGTAYFLGREAHGRRLGVTVLEAGMIGRQASGVNAGTLSHQNKPTQLCGTCIDAYHLWLELERSLPGGLEFLPKGGFCVAQSEGDEEELTRLYRIRKEAGLPLEWLDRGRLSTRHPWLSSSVRAATYNPLDAQASPLRVVYALSAALRQLGVTVIQNSPVLRVEHTGADWLLLSSGFRLRAPVVVVAAGGWSDDVGRYFGCQVPLERKVPQLAITESLPIDIPHVVVHVNGRLTLKQYPTGQAMLGGGWQGIPLDPGYHATALRRESVAGGLAIAASVVPALRSVRVVRMWCRMEAFSPDRLPYLGPYPGKPGLLFAVPGFGGFTLGPAFAHLVADAFLGRGPSLPRWANPGRFDSGIPRQLPPSETRPVQ